MERAKIRRWLLVLVVVLAAASMFPFPGGSSHPSVPQARHTTLTAKHQGNDDSHAPPVRSLP
jgi:hypothetical protein